MTQALNQLAFMHRLVRMGWKWMVGWLVVWIRDRLMQVHALTQAPCPPPLALSLDVDVDVRILCSEGVVLCGCMCVCECGYFFKALFLVHALALSLSPPDFLLFLSFPSSITAPTLLSSAHQSFIHSFIHSFFPPP